MSDKDAILALIAGGGSAYEAPQINAKAEAAKIVAENPPSLLEGLARSFQQGGLLGFADEAEAKAVAKMDASKADAPAIEDLTKEIIRAENRKFSEDHPYLSFGASLLGGIPSALIAAPQGLLARMALGAGLGGAMGAGSAEDEDRLAGALVGGTLGGGTAALAPLAVKGLARAGQEIADVLDTSGVLDAATSLEGQRGAVGALGKADGTRKSPAELALLKFLKDQSPEEIAAMQKTLAEGQAQGTPLVLADVAGPRTQGLADYLANVAPEGMEIAPGVAAPRTFLNKRVAAQPERIQSLVAPLSPEGTSYAADATARKIAQDAERAFEGLREDISGPLYAAIQQYEPTPELQRATAEPAVKQAIEYLRNDSILGPKYQALADTDPRLLIQARKITGELAGKAKDAAEREKAAAIMQSREMLTNALDAQPDFRVANDTYREASRPLSVLFGDSVQGAPGTIAELLKQPGVNSKNAGEVILQLAPEQIEQTKALLGEKGVKLMRAGVKSYVLDVAGQARTGTAEAANKLFRSLDSRASIEAALGKEEAEKLLKKIGFEKLVAESSKRLASGSPTAPRQAAEKYFESSAPKLQSLAQKAFTPSEWGDELMNLLSVDDNEMLKKGVAKLLFDPYSSADFLARNSDLAQSLAARNQATNELIQYLAPKASQIGGISSAQLGTGRGNK